MGSSDAWVLRILYSVNEGWTDMERKEWHEVRIELRRELKKVRASAVYLQVWMVVELRHVSQTT